MQFDKAAAIVNGTLYNSEAAGRVFRGVSIDSRTVQPGEMFIAIRGERNDGHDFITGALDRGAAGVMVEFAYPRLEHLPGHTPVIAVPHSHEAMMKLAAAYRQTIPVRIIGITGSNGKTTTKELAYRLILALEEKTYRSPGNLNNLYGAPLALLRMPRDTRFAVMELGISTRTEMPRLAELVKPDVIVLTNVGATHLEFLGSVEAVARAKLQLVELAAEDVPVIVNADDAVLMRETRKVRSRFTTFGIEQAADFKPESIVQDESGGSKVVIENNSFYLPLLGRHQISNLLAAYAAARALGCNLDDVETAALELNTAPWRGQSLQREGIHFIADCYNANPESMKAGVTAFLNLPVTGRRWLILGDMLELGPDAVKYHTEIGRAIARYEFDKLVTVGRLAEHIGRGARAAGIPDNKLLHYGNAGQCVAGSKDMLASGDHVYLKASRGIELEKMLEAYRSGEDA